MEAIDKTNFYIASNAMFLACEAPDRAPDYASESGSMYWYDSEYLYRRANHWGVGVMACNWYIVPPPGVVIAPSPKYTAWQTEHPIVGRVAWRDMRWQTASELYKLGPEKLARLCETFPKIKTLL